jgi:outer membrane immunogenic protein
MEKSSLNRIALVAFAALAVTTADRAYAESSDTRRIEELEKENAAMRARLRRLEAQSENTSLRAKIDKLQARRSAAPREADVPAPATRLEASAPDRTLILADMPVKAPPVIAPWPSDWSGVYVGFEGGYGWGKQDLNVVFPGIAAIAGVVQFPDVAYQSSSQKGWLLGGVAGVQKQWGSWVFGIEADFDAAAIKNSALATSAAPTMFFLGGVGPPACGANSTLCFTQTVSGASKIDELGSLRGKAGFVPTPNLLIYGTGGLGVAHVKNDFTFTYSTQVGPAQAPDAPIVAVSAGGTSILGWAAGAGVDWKLPADAGSAWVFGIEYLHYDFGSQTITVSNNAGASSAFHTSVSADTVKARLSYLFNIH